MALQLIFLIASILPLTLAETNFWGNEICHSNSDCSGLTECDLTFGCQLAIWKVAVIAFSVVIFIGLAYVACYCLGFCGVVMMYRRNRSNNRNLINPVIVHHPPTQNSGFGPSNAAYPSNSASPTNVAYPANVPYPTNVHYTTNISTNNVPYPIQNTQYNQQQIVDPISHYQQSTIGFKQ